MRQVFGHRPRPRAALATAAVAVAALVISACGSGGGSSSGSAASSGGSATFALPPDATPNWIFPIQTPAHLASYNSSIFSEMYLPLYNYDTSSGSLSIDESESAAEAPVYSNGDTTVTITLRNLTWSNGQPLTSRDVQFWYNLVESDKSEWGAYSQGDIPDNIKSFTIVNSRTFRLQLTKAYSPGWYTANQLSLITPIPQSAWDVTSTGGKADDYDETTAGAKQVLTYLISQAGSISSYDTSPLWKVTDGPFKLQSWNTSGNVVLAKSTTYKASGQAKLDSVTFQPYTSDEAEFDELRAGGIDYGYVPITDLAQEKLLEADGYKIEPWVGWAVSYIPYNFNNPSMGAVFKQLYVRQALQEAVDQNTIANDIWHGEATVGYGPVPQTSASGSYLSATQKDNPYPYDIAKAKALLTSHGWTITGGGATCTGDCGTGIAKGTKLNLTIISESGSTETTNMMEELQSSFSEIGVNLSIKQDPLDTVLNDSAICTASQASCSWQLSFFGTQGSWYYPAYPSGEQIFATGAGVNLGSYSSTEADQLIQETNSSSSSSAMQAYSAYLAENLPVIWVPNPDYQVSAIKNTLGGVVQNPLATMNPQQWYETNG
jgi:peptide/nickel transport system substrate-binding protein